MSLRTTIDFLLHDWLHTTALATRARYAEHSRETMDAVLDTCERLAREKYAPFNRLVDVEEPYTVTEPDGSLRVVLPQATHEAFKAYAACGMLSAAQDYAMGGMQLPYSVEAAANALLSCASVSINASLLSVANANLLMAHATPWQKQVFAHPQFAGRWAGTMCLSEPQAGSSLSDVATRAIPDGADFADDPLGPRYRIKGCKMWISNGDHELTENIVHLVLAKIADANGQLTPGTRGLSLFIVPKKLVDAEGQLTGARNDVALAGLNHKCGWRGTPNTLLNFGEGRYPVGHGGFDGQGAGALGYLVGTAGSGLACMFHMMNEARIGVGMAATMLGMAAYQASLEYAKTRTQGRPLSGGGKNAATPQSRIIEHADVKRMLLAQKSYAEGALALALYCARLVDEQRSAAEPVAQEAGVLLEVLTPIAKSWPSEWCLEGNSLAIQVHAGYGYTRDFPVEQYWRDNRLNMIHEGTHGIQALDLLGRKVVMQEGRALQLLAHRMRATMDKARQFDALVEPAQSLAQALTALERATQAAWSTGHPADALANAVPYMQAFGHTVLAWMWLDVACSAVAPTPAHGARQATAQDPAPMSAANVGRLGAMRFFFRYELPKIGAWLAVVQTRERTCADFPEEAF